MVVIFSDFMFLMFWHNFFLRRPSLIRRCMWTWAESALDGFWRWFLSFFGIMTFTVFDTAWVASTVICRVEIANFGIEEEWTFSLRVQFLFLYRDWRIKSNFSMSLLLSAIVISAWNSGRFALVKRFMILATRITSWLSFIKVDYMSCVLVGWRYLIYTL